MSNVFEDLKKGHVYGGHIYGVKTKKSHEKKETPAQEIAEHRVNPYKVEPYYEGGLKLETYGESKLRGFRRAVVRKAPIVTKQLVTVGKQTITPAVKDAFKAVGRVGLKIGKAQFDDLKRRKQKGMNVFW